MPQPNDLSRSLAALDQDSTLIAVIEMSQASWLVGAMVPGVERHPLKKLGPMQKRCRACCTAGATRRARPAGRLPASRLPTRLAATASGWPAGCGRAVSRST